MMMTMQSQTPVVASGLYYPNKIARIYFEAIESLLGKSAMADMLRRGGLERYADAFPPDNLERQFDFADFSTVTGLLEAEQRRDPQRPSLSEQAGRRCYQGGLKATGGLAGFGRVTLSFQVLSDTAKMKMGLGAMALIFSTFSDQKTEVSEAPDHFVYTIFNCPMCQGRHADRAICEGASGLLAEGIHWVTDREYPVTETTCRAKGDATCTFVISKTPIGQ